MYLEQSAGSHELQMMSQRSSSAQQNYASACQYPAHDAHVTAAHLAARYRRAQWILADRDLLIHNAVRKVILATGHRAYKDRDIVRLR